MDKQTKNECQCKKTACGCADAATSACKCGEGCGCQRACRCDGGCGCATKK